VRRAATLIEMAAAIAIAGMVLAAATTGLGRLRRLAEVDVQLGARAEMACDRLRRDLARGPARWQDGALRIAVEATEVVWRVEAGQLLRGGCLQVAVRGFSAECLPGGMAVTMNPPDLPPRRIEAWR
jgi:type II secretory pathway pseudopilin PulG